MKLGHWDHENDCALHAEEIEHEHAKKLHQQPSDIVVESDGKATRKRKAPRNAHDQVTEGKFYYYYDYYYDY